MDSEFGDQTAILFEANDPSKKNRIIVFGIMKITHEEITERAFQIWKREGKPEGCEQEHWFQAEEELRKEKVKGQKSQKQFARQKGSQ